MIRIGKGPVSDRHCRLRGISHMLTVPADMISDLWKPYLIDILYRQPAVSDHFTGILKTYGPKSESIKPVSVHILMYPVPYFLLIESVGIVLHALRIG